MFSPTGVGVFRVRRGGMVPEVVIQFWVRGFVAARCFSCRRFVWIVRIRFICLVRAMSGVALGFSVVRRGNPELPGAMMLVFCFWLRRGCRI